MHTFPSQRITPAAVHIEWTATGAPIDGPRLADHGNQAEDQLTSDYFLPRLFDSAGHPEDVIDIGTGPVHCCRRSGERHDGPLALMDAQSLDLPDYRFDLAIVDFVVVHLHTFEPRGQIEVKCKGSMTTYFLIGH